VDIVAIQQVVLASSPFDKLTLRQAQGEEEGLLMLSLSKHELVEALAYRSMRKP
jgi:hypothetical protein